MGWKIGPRNVEFLSDRNRVRDRKPPNSFLCEYTVPSNRMQWKNLCVSVCVWAEAEEREWVETLASLCVDTLGISDRTIWGNLIWIS